MEDILGGGKTLRERLGVQAEPARQEPQRETRECNVCHKFGHIARNCRMLPGANAPLVPTLPAPSRSFESHQTEGAVCTGYKRTGHVEAQCWSSHLELRPKDLKNKRGGNMSALRKRLKAAEHTSPGYAYQGALMAMTYVRPTTALPLAQDRGDQRVSLSQLIMHWTERHMSIPSEYISWRGLSLSRQRLRRASWRHIR